MMASTRRAALGAMLAAPLASVPALAASEYADQRALLLAAWEEAQLAYPYADASPGMVEEIARSIVMKRLWDICGEIVDLPAPKTHYGTLTVAMATAVMWEGEQPDYTQERSAIALIRAVLSVSKATMPSGFCGFGDEPGYYDREDLRSQGQGSLPAWALAKAEARLCA